MDQLEDKILLNIFSRLSLIERVNIRRVNKRFQSLCDSICIRKLVVYESKPLLIQKCRLTDEPFSTVDVACVNLKKFFSSSKIIKCMESIEKLVIISAGKQMFTLNARFNHLTHLELEDAYLENSPIFKSPNLTHFSHIRCHFVSSDQSTLEGKNKIVTIFGCDTLECKLKHLHVFDMLPKLVFEYCKKHNKLSNLERLDCQVENFEVLFYIINNFPTLKMIKVCVGLSFEEFQSTLSNVRKDELTKNLLRDNLTVYIWGIEFSKRNEEFFHKFFNSKLMQMLCGVPELQQSNQTIGYVADPLSNMFMYQFQQECDLTDFYKLITRIMFSELSKHNMNRELFANFINVEEMMLSIENEDCNLYSLVDDYDDYSFDEYLKLFSKKLVRLNIVNEPNLNLNDELLESIPEHCQNLKVLVIANWDITNFHFLHRMKHVKMVTISGKRPINENRYLELIKTMGKQVDKFDLCYDKPANLNKAELSTFKQRVLQCIRSDTTLNSRNPKFKIQIQDNSLVRYVYEIDSMDTMDAADLARFVGSLLPQDLATKFMQNFRIN